MVPCGVNNAPEWALDKIGQPRPDGPAYTYPDTTNPVRLYLIDTAVANTGNWMGANPKLVFEKSVKLRGINDPPESSTDHGTKMLSLIAGMNTGIAPGTPIHVVNFDIFTVSGSTVTTTTSLLIDALKQAVADHKAQVAPNKMPAVICIATSSETPAISGALSFEIGKAVTAGIPVIVSAGNQGPTGNAASYIPAAYGTMEGVICVGASNSNDLAISISNTGTPVDLLAPGNSVRVRTDVAASPFGFMTGTSPASALVAGSALIELSINGLESPLTPAEVESRLKARGQTSSGSWKPENSQNNLRSQPDRQQLDQQS